MDIEEIKKRKLEELNKQLDEQMQEESQLQQQIQQIELAVKQKMTRGALERFGNIKTAYPEKAIQVLVVLARGIQLGKIATVDDATLKEILQTLTLEKRDMQIRKR